jgi:SAM-dependent methyltransferase
LRGEELTSFVQPTIYDGIASIYDRWLTGDEAAQPCLEFYLDEMSDEAGPVLELGIGTGRISQGLAGEGITNVVGIDASMEMLRRSRSAQSVNKSATSPAVARAVCGLFERLPFADRSFTAVVLPMRTLGHLVDPLSRRAMFAEVNRILLPGGRFVFDHYNFDRTWAEAHDGCWRLMYAGQADGSEDTALLIWDRYDYNFDAKTLHCTVLAEEARPLTAPLSAISVEFDFRWFEKQEIDQHAIEVGLVIEQCWGGFDRAPFGRDSEHMVFVLRKPLCNILLIIHMDRTLSVPDTLGKSRRSM